MPKADSLSEGHIDRIVVQLTQGNLSYSHIYLGKHPGFFPRDAIGAGNARDGEGALLTLHFAGLPEPVKTDLDGKKWIFRCRGPVGEILCPPSPEGRRQHRYRPAICTRVSHPPAR